MTEKYATWLAGLLATDGHIHDKKCSRAYDFVISTIEEDWAERISDRLDEAGLRNSVNCKEPTESGYHNKNVYKVYINSKDICEFFNQHDIEEFLSGRKYELLKKAQEFYLSDEYDKNYDYGEWNEEVKQKMIRLCIENPEMSDRKLAERLPIEKSAVSRHRIELDIPGTYARRKMDETELEQIKKV